MLKIVSEQIFKKFKMSPFNVGIFYYKFLSLIYKLYCV